MGMLGFVCVFKRGNRQDQGESKKTRYLILQNRGGETGERVLEWVTGKSLRGPFLFFSFFATVVIFKIFFI